MSSNVVFRAAFVLALCAKLGLGLQITSPSEGDSWNPSDSLAIKWTSVSTDPDTFGIKITNQDSNTYPTGFTQPVTSDVKTSDGSYSASGFDGLKQGSGYKVNFISSSGEILAQSAPFNVTGTSSSGAHKGSDSNHNTTADSAHHDVSGNHSTSSHSTDSSSNTNSAKVDSDSAAHKASSGAVCHRSVPKVVGGVSAIALLFLVAA
eukprot:GHVU01006621.1.p1 GENE.GHVU01006621.1~~GHVU01006621.1.p1  ORF type:complete len:206 (+),score=14.98 GHVU01006621.1:159-776(+)